MAASQPSTQRQTRERDLVAATRALFDERGVQDAPIEDIAKAVGIARGLIYRQFSSKEELFFLTVTLYLDELAELLEAATAAEPDPAEQLERLMETYAAYCLRYPAFLDCSQSLMRQRTRDLRETVSESVWLRLGQGMARCIEQVARALRAGVEAGRFDVQDPPYMANVLWTQTLGAMHMARMRVGVHELAPGVPGLFAVDPDRLVRTCVASVLATVGATPAR